MNLALRNAYEAKLRAANTATVPTLPFYTRR